MEAHDIIKVTTPQNPLRCHNLLTAVKRGEIEFTPKFATEFLQSTNNRKNMAVLREVLENHLAAHPEIAPAYQNILANLDLRQGLPLAIDKEQTETKIVSAVSPDKDLNITTKTWYTKNSDYSSINRMILDKCVTNVYCTYCKLSDTRLELTSIDELKNLEFIGFNSSKAPKKMNFAFDYVKWMVFSHMDLSQTEMGYPKKMEQLCFSERTQFPPVLDLSHIEKVQALGFRECNMANIKEIKLPQSIEMISFQYCTIPSGLDLDELRKHYTVEEIDCKTDYSNMDNIVLKNMITTKGR